MVDYSKKLNSNTLLAISQIKDGNMSFKWGDQAEVLKNRTKFFNLIGINPGNSVFMAVQNGSDIAKTTQKDKGKGMKEIDSAIKSDGLITNEKGLYLSLLIADCLPIAFYDGENSAIGLGHLGWRGTDAGLSQKIVKKMHEEFCSHPKNIKVMIGPGIHKESYIMKDPVQKQNNYWHKFLTDLPDGMTSIDNVESNRQQLIEAGILPENIEIISIDTAVDRNFFSHYRSNKTGETEGRFLTVFGLK